MNESLRALVKDGFLLADMQLSKRALALLAAHRPRQAVILAAGCGIRMAPLQELPKGLYKIRGERLIDRTIAQLHAAGIQRITIVTGFMKEKYEYLSKVDGIQLIFNHNYLRKNNLHSLLLASDCLENAYILPSDLWFGENPFSSSELYAWYMLTAKRNPAYEASLNRKQEMIAANDDEAGMRMIGVAYLSGDASRNVAALIKQRAEKRHYQLDFWESVLLYAPCQPIYGRVVPNDSVHEINTFEDLRALDYAEDQLGSEALNEICRALHTTVPQIGSVEIMKKGMTNRSFLFAVNDKRYIMRIPGEGSNTMIDRTREYATYCILQGTSLCDEIITISPDTGYKISVFWENARVCDPFDAADVFACMRLLRAFHERGYAVPYTFDLFERIDYYESLFAPEPSVYDDYATVKSDVFALRSYIDRAEKTHCLTHIDAVPDNFLFIEGGVRLIDWEYAAMQDPHVDIAMFAIYSLYDDAHVEALIECYFPEGCPNRTRAKIYCYIAVCGLLWSNWCEYKRMLGIEFGDYALMQYRFARRYAAIAAVAIQRVEENV